MKRASLRWLLVILGLGLGVPCVHYVQRSFLSQNKTSPGDDVVLSDEEVDSLTDASLAEVVGSNTVTDPVPALEASTQTKVEAVAVNSPVLPLKGGYQPVEWDDLGTLDPETGKSLNEKVKNALSQPAAVPGYIVPLADGGDLLDEFLFVPEPMMCIHVPAPPPQFIIMAKMKEPLKFPEDFSTWEPYWIKGALRIQQSKSELADAAYLMSVDSIEKYDQPGQNR